MPLLPGSPDPSQVLLVLQSCLNDLDRIGASLSAVHVSTAIEELRLQFNLPRDPTESD